MRRIAATILLTLLALTPQEAAAASCYSSNYQKAEELFRQGSYSAAIKRYRAAKACPDKPKSNNIDARISECNRRLNPPKPTYYLTVDGGRSYVSASFSSSGGSQWFSVSTNASSWSTWGVPSWCSVSRSSSGFTLTCEANNSTSSRSDYMKIQAGGKEVRIDISQAGNPNTRSAEIKSIWVDHNQIQDGTIGMLIHVKFDVNNMLNRNGRCNIYFYHESGEALKDTNGNYHTTDGFVACWEDFKPRYKNSSYSDFKLFMPYKELHITSSGKYSLKFYVCIRDRDAGEWLCDSSDWQYFTYTR